jgi:signal recognition particle subunit SRP19
MVEIEEIEDSDPEEMDIDEYDDHDPAPLRPAIPRPAQPPATTLVNPANIPMQAQNSLRTAPTTQTTPEQNKERSKHWQCLYPVYFDKNKSRAEGRRVGKELAVANPLARELAEAVASLEYNVVFEPNKTHPKDWSNPGRCRVLIKENGKPVGSTIKNSTRMCYSVRVNSD